MLHYTGCGLRAVWLKNGYTVNDTPYGQATAIHNHKAYWETLHLENTETGQRTATL